MDKNADESVIEHAMGFRKEQEEFGMLCALSHFCGTGAVSFPFSYWSRVHSSVVGIRLASKLLVCSFALQLFVVVTSDFLTVDRSS